MTTATEIWAYRNLIYNLAQRELRSRYKKSIGGWAWSLINPASTLLIYTMVFGVFLGGQAPLMGNGRNSVFALYLFSGLVAWNCFSGVVNGSILALQNAGSLLNKVYFPPSIPAIANLFTVLLQTLIEGAILVVIMLAMGNVSFTLVLFPLMLVFLSCFALGVGLIVSVYNVYLRDVGYITSIGMNLLFYSTPIVYTLSKVPESKFGIPLHAIISANPVTRFVEWSRDAFYLLQWPSLSSWITIVGWAVVGLVGGFVVFQRKARNVTEEL